MTWLAMDQTNEHMKTRLYLTDVVVLRKERDTVNFSGLQITKTSQDVGVRKGTELVDFLVNLNPGRRSTVMELATAILLDGHDYSNFRTAVDKFIFMALWRPDMQFATNQLSTQVLNPTTENKRAVTQLILPFPPK